MKESMWGYLIVSLGLIIITIIVFVQNITTTTEEDFYLGREVLESSMYDAIDYGIYKSTGEIVMSKEKFTEVFLRRFADSISGNKDYKIEFYDINEKPPKATVRILTNSGSATISSTEDTTFDVDLNTYLTGILETNDSYLNDMTTYEIDGVVTDELKCTGTSTANCRINASELKFNIESATIHEGEELKILVVDKPINENITWKVFDQKVTKIKNTTSDTITIVGLKEGETSVIGTVGDARQRCDIKVIK